MMNIHWVPGLSLEAVEKECILQAIRYFRGNKTAAANSLGISVRNVDQKLAKYQQDDASLKRKEDEREQKHRDYLDRARGQAPDQLQRIAAAEQKNKALRLQRERGERMESTDEVSEKQPVSVPVGQEVQAVLPNKANGGNTKRGGRGVQASPQAAEHRISNGGTKTGDTK